MKKILIVDDNHAFLNGMRAFLQGAGIDADISDSVADARYLLVAHRYEVALLDISLTGSTGTEGFRLLEDIRSSNAGTRVVLMTAYGNAGTREDVLEAGADLFLEKPVYPQTVLDILAGRSRENTP